MLKLISPSKKAKIAIAIFGLLAGMAFLISGLWIPLKASLAQYLIRSSWQQSLVTQQSVKPWDWADTWPVARLKVSQHDVDLIVLNGDSGRTLAFGPGFNPSSAIPGKVGNSVISAHRDTHFQFLQHVEIGQTLTLQSSHGDLFNYQVVNTEIVDARKHELVKNTNASYLTLVTCYPFDSLQSGGPLRYLVYAQLVDPVLL